MISKTIEIRDRQTLIPALAVRLEPASERDCVLLARAGFGRSPDAQRQYIVLYALASLMLTRCRATSDPYEWADRTMQVAHEWLQHHFDEIESGAVVDVEFILGETRQPKTSEL